MMNQVYFISFVCLWAVAFAGEYGDTCTDDAGCSGLTNGRCEQWDKCTKKSCTCKKGYTMITDSKCLKEAKLGDECEDDLQCIADNVECSTSGSKKVCTCRKGYEKDGDDCVGKIALGATTCNDDNKCKAGYCSSGTCKCYMGEKQDGGECRNYYEGEDCNSSDKLCVSTLTCSATTNKCECSDSGYKFYTYYRRPNELKGCLHPDAKRDLGHGDACNTNRDSTGKWCGKKYFCYNCPGEQTKKCLSGGWMVMASTSLLVFMAAFTSIYTL